MVQPLKLLVISDGTEGVGNPINEAYHEKATRNKLIRLQMSSDNSRTRIQREPINQLNDQGTLEEVNYKYWPNSMLNYC